MRLLHCPCKEPLYGLGLCYSHFQDACELSRNQRIELPDAAQRVAEKLLMARIQKEG